MLQSDTHVDIIKMQTDSNSCNSSGMNANTADTNEYKKIRIPSELQNSIQSFLNLKT